MCLWFGGRFTHSPAPVRCGSPSPSPKCRHHILLCQGKGAPGTPGAAVAQGLVTHGATRCHSQSMGFWGCNHPGSTGRLIIRDWGAVCGPCRGSLPSVPIPAPIFLQSFSFSLTPRFSWQRRWGRGLSKGMAGTLPGTLLWPHPEQHSQHRPSEPAKRL